MEECGYIIFIDLRKPIGLLESGTPREKRRSNASGYCMGYCDPSTDWKSIIVRGLFHVLLLFAAVTGYGILYVYKLDKNSRLSVCL